jgi:phosphatidylserine/phosphatidylglycerophosphate/cardiolipin synthase-like enzyme
VAEEEEELFVDVPIELLREAVELEAPAQRLLPKLEIDREVRVKPLLTPDKKGAVYTNAVLDLIESAEEQIVFQNQYIMMASNQSANLDKLVDALIEKANEGLDVRIIVRTGGDTFKDDVAVLRRRGLKVNDVMRRIPKTHTKGIVVDGKRVLVGSQNWSGLAVSENRDASLIFEDEEIAKYFLEAFNIDWNRAPSMKGEGAEPGGSNDLGPRLARATDLVPQGFRRIPLDDYLEG